MTDKIYFVQSAEPTLPKDSSFVVSLSPQASYFLARKGFSYMLLEDLEWQRELSPHQDDYFRQQLQWFRSFDAFLTQHIRFLAQTRLEPARFHYSRLKYVLDTVVMKAKALRRLLDAEKPREAICFPKAESSDSYSLHEFRHRASHVIWEILANCPQLQIKVMKETATPQSFDSISWLRKWIRLPRFVKKSKPGAENFFFLDKGNDVIDSFMKEAAAAGKGICKAYPPRSPMRQDIREDCLRASVALDKNEELFQWMDQEAGIPVASILKTYLKDFIETVCSPFLSEVESCRAFLKEQRIDYVVARSGTGKENAKFLAAAFLANIQTVCFQHGYSYLHWPDCVVTELDAFTTYFASDTESKKYFTNYAQYDTLRSVKVLESAHELKKLVRREARGLKAKLVIYPEKKFPQDRLRFNDGNYFRTWYFELQKAIVTYFARQKEFQFVYKHSSGEDWAEASIIPFIYDLQADNIRVESKPFKSYLGEADAVIMDFPSSAFYESVAAGVPILSLHADFVRTWEPMAQRYSREIQTFRTINEAVAKIEAFLSAPMFSPPPLELSLESLSSVLKQLDATS